MEDKEKIKEYALKNYKKTFIKKVITRDAKGKITRRQFIDLEPIVLIKYIKYPKLTFIFTKTKFHCLATHT